MQTSSCQASKAQGKLSASAYPLRTHNRSNTPGRPCLAMPTGSQQQLTTAHCASISTAHRVTTMRSQHALQGSSVGVSSACHKARAGTMCHTRAVAAPLMGPLPVHLKPMHYWAPPEASGLPAGRGVGNASAMATGPQRQLSSSGLPASVSWSGASTPTTPSAIGVVASGGGNGSGGGIGSGCHVTPPAKRSSGLHSGLLAVRPGSSRCATGRLSLPARGLWR